MNLEKYKAEMSREQPDRLFIESTLARLKTERKSKINTRQLLKTAGGFAFAAAMLGGALVGAGAIRSFFSSIEPISDDFSEFTKENIIEETPEITENIIATDNELLATPLASNPKYTVKVTTPDGKVSLNENTTMEEMLACGLTVVTDNGTLGVQYLCEAIRKQKKGEEFEYIYADTTDGNIYYYFDVNKNGQKEKNWEYNHQKFFYIVKRNEYMLLPFACYTWSLSEEVGIVSIGKDRSLGFVTVTDLLNATILDKEERKSIYYKNVSESTNEEEPILGIIYNGECKGAFRMNHFLKKIENGESYAAVQYTDITTTKDYSERYYSIEYLNGSYSIFTMTDGILGEFDTQYFDDCEVTGNYVVFDNGQVRYRFMLSEDTYADVQNYCTGYRTPSNLIIDGDNLHGNWGYNDFYNYLSPKSDRFALEKYLDENLMELVVINEELSKDGYYACEIAQPYTERGQNHKSVYLKTTNKIIGENSRGEKYFLGEINLLSDMSVTFFEEIDGKYYVMLTEEEMKKIMAWGHTIEETVLPECGKAFRLGLSRWINDTYSLSWYD